MKEYKTTGFPKGMDVRNVSGSFTKEDISGMVAWKKSDGYEETPIEQILGAGIAQVYIDTQNGSQFILSNLMWIEKEMPQSQEGTIFSKFFCL